MEEIFKESCDPLFYTGFVAAMVTDRDGVIVLKHVSDKATEDMVGPSIPTKFSIASNQASKLGLQHNKSIISVYDKYQTIQLDQSPLVITIIAESSANTGLFMNLGNNILKLIEPLAEAMKEQ